MKYLIYLFVFLLPLSSISQYGNKKRMYSGYTLVNEGLEQTRAVINGNGDMLYYNLTLKFQQDGDSAQLDFDLGMKIRDTASTLIKYINEMKVLLISKCEDKKRNEIEGEDTIISLKYLENFDDYTTPAKILFGEDSYDVRKGEFSAFELQNKMIAYKSLMDSVWLDDESLNVAIDHLTNLNGWSRKRKQFKEKPLVSIITSLSKLQLDIKLQEQAAVRYLIQR